MSTFHFKQFAIIQNHSAMKVGTDSVLLGSLSASENPLTILDIGTGTGILSLMMAQRFQNAQITAIEKEPETAKEAQENCANSIWDNRIIVKNDTLQTWLLNHKESFDLIVCNPPYYDSEQHYEIADLKRATARQNHHLTLEDLIEGISQLLNSNGICWLVLPYHQLSKFEQLSKEQGLYLTQQINIIPKPSKHINRVLIGVTPLQATLQQSTFTIYDDNNNPTEDYKNITYPFLLWNKD